MATQRSSRGGNNQENEMKQTKNNWARWMVLLILANWVVGTFELQSAIPSAAEWLDYVFSDSVESMSGWRQLVTGWMDMIMIGSFLVPCGFLFYLTKQKGV